MKKRKGFTLVDIIFASLFLSIVVLTSFKIYNTINTLEQKDNDISFMNLILSNKIEEINSDIKNLNESFEYYDAYGRKTERNKKYILRLNIIKEKNSVIKLNLKLESIEEKAIKKEITISLLK